MGNDVATAEKGASFVATRPYLTGATAVLDQFRAGRISRLCDCGCESFDITVPPTPGLEPLVPASAAGAHHVLSMSFYVADASDGRNTVEIDVFADDSGYLSGINIFILLELSCRPERHAPTGTAIPYSGNSGGTRI